MTTRFIDHLITGDHASLPAANAVPQGTLYSCTDHGKIYQSDGVATWSDWATITGAAPGTHATSHENGGADEISVAGLSGLLADPQLVNVHKNGTIVGTRKNINLIEGTNVTLTVADDAGDDEIDVTIDASGGGGAPAAHAASHENGGSDEISVAGLSGLLADDQNPVAHATDHQNGGADEISVTGLSGLLADPQNADKILGVTVDDTAIGDGKVLVFKSGSGNLEYEAPSGGGGALLDETRRYPYLKNAAAHADDDDFTSDLGTYTDVNWSGQTTVDYDTTVKSALYIKHPVSGATTLRAKLLPILAGDWSVVLDITVPLRNSAGLPCGLLFTDGVTAGAGNQNIIAIATSAGVMVSIGPRYTNFTTFAATTLAATAWGGGNRVFIRVDRASSVYTVYFGYVDHEGNIHWTAGETMAMMGTISHYGIGYFSSNTGQPLTLAFHGLWVFPTSYPANGMGVLRNYKYD